jgi:hypothetical protein
MQFVITILVLAILLIGVASAKAQQEDNRTIIGGVEVPSDNVDQNAIDYYHKAIDVATLHNASSDTINILNAQNHVYSCLDNLVSQQDESTASECDDSMTHAIVNHELGNNQTIIKLAHVYLKARGIQ